MCLQITGHMIGMADTRDHLQNAYLSSTMHCTQLLTPGMHLLTLPLQERHQGQGQPALWPSACDGGKAVIWSETVRDLIPVKAAPGTGTQI